MENEKKEKEKEDIWEKGVKSIFNFHKFDLMRYIDAVSSGIADSDTKAKAAFKNIRGRVFDSLTRATVEVGTLFETWRRGGDISGFESYLSLKNTEGGKREGKRRFNTPRIKGDEQSKAQPDSGRQD